MLSIFLLATLTVILFVFSQRTFRRESPAAGAASRKGAPPGRLPRFLGVVFFNVLIVECFAYLCLIFLIFYGNSFFLIGNQKILDKLIKFQLTDAVYVSRDRHNDFYQIDNELGYTVGKKKKFYLYATNHQGIRADREYALLPDEGTVRMAVFGDSFVFCDGEKNVNGWPHFLEKSIGHLEVLNFGVSGYGLGQSYLRYLKDGVKFKPDIVLFNYITTGPRDGLGYGDLLAGRTPLRLSTLYRAIFRVEDGILISRAVTPFDFFDPDFREEYIYRPLGLSERQAVGPRWFGRLNTTLLLKHFFLQKKFSSMAAVRQDIPIDINIKILDNLLKVAEENKSMVLFFCPGEYDGLPGEIKLLLRRHAGHAFYVNFNRSLNYYLETRALNKEELLNDSNHFRPRGNLVYAQLLAAILQEQVWGEGERTFRFDTPTRSFVRVP
ncbi:MAG: SGNH/GDSL hydrolase family protein [Candidatus Omnitrophota bacterium]